MAERAPWWPRWLCNAMLTAAHLPARPRRHTCTPPRRLLCPSLPDLVRLCRLVGQAARQVRQPRIPACIQQQLAYLAGARLRSRGRVCVGGWGGVGCGGGGGGGGQQRGQERASSAATKAMAGWARQERAGMSRGSAAQRRACHTLAPAAKWSGVLPRVFSTLTSAPRSKSSFAASTEPLRKGKASAEWGMGGSVLVPAHGRLGRRGQPRRQGILAQQRSCSAAIRADALTTAQPRAARSGQSGC